MTHFQIEKIFLIKTKICGYVMHEKSLRTFFVLRVEGNKAFDKAVKISRHVFSYYLFCEK